MVNIKGIQKTSLLDYPGKFASVIFLGGCNFRCRFCHNPTLICDQLPNIDETEVFEFLASRKKWIDGIVIGGGEPTLNKDLPELIRKIKSLGFLIKLDTNGTNPEMLDSLIKEKLIDYIAMDIKTSLEKYSKITRVEINPENIKKSIKLIMNSGINYEFRTTLVPCLHDKEDLFELVKTIKGAKKFYLQQFQNINVLDETLKDEKAFDESKLNELKELIKDNFEFCGVRV